MARIVVDAYLVRCPLGGFVSWVLQYLLGFQRLGHDVYFVERSEFVNACYDPVRMESTDDCSHGVAAIARTFEQHGLRDNWCFVDVRGTHFGLSEAAIDEVLSTADFFIDLGPYGAWLERASVGSAKTVMIDAEPGFTQMRWQIDRDERRDILHYDAYFTIGQNVGSSDSSCPDVGLSWNHIFQPVVVDLFDVEPPPADGGFTTIMNWQSHETFEFGGQSYGQKDLEFAHFLDLPTRVETPLEIAVSRSTEQVRARLRDHGWRVHSGQGKTLTLDAYYDHIQTSRGEFSVAKNVFVETNCGWFSDRSAVYLASGRPVVLQSCGFEEHLPCGEGLFAVRTVEEAADAIERIQADYALHSDAARQIAIEYLDASKVLRRFLTELT
jgi:hypothetical protein